MHVVRKADIEAALAHVDVAGAIAEGFVAYSNGRTVVPPVGELRFDAPPGDVHIKYGYVRGGETYVVKIASGFYENPLIGLPSSNGLMLVFAQKTGELRAVLLDEGLLTDVRTAAAGAVAAKHLAPPDVRAIGIVGTGIQAGDAVLHAVARGEDEHRHVAPRRAPAPQHGQAVEHGQAQVKHHGGVIPGHQGGLGADAVPDPIDDMVGLTQADLQRVAEQSVVFNQQDSHRQDSNCAWRPKPMDWGRGGMGK